jgi:hypothetical protein
MISITTRPNESSTIKIAVTFTDLDGNLFHPKTCVYSLSDSTGNIIGSIDRTVVTIIGTSHNFIISGTNLQITGSDPGKRIVTIEGTYDCLYGNDLPFREECMFEIENTVINAYVAP